MEASSLEGFLIYLIQQGDYIGRNGHHLYIADILN